MRHFITKYRKIIAVFAVILAAVIITVATIGVVNSVTAGVFKGSDDKNKLEKGEGNEIVILEIVALNGQQVIGYTIPGYEPITKEAIEAYPIDGPADLSSSDFTAATGWKVKKTNTGYVVNKDGSPLYDKFSKNVFGDALDTASDVKVIVKQANEVTSDDVVNCDLVYVNNPSNNHENLLYYYDQVMNYNPDTHEYSEKYAPGKLGPHYNTVTYEKVLAKDLAVKLIKDAAGRATAYNLEDVIDRYYNAESITNTKSIFEIAGMNNYRECNENEYIEEIANREKHSITDETDIYNLIEYINYIVQEEAIEEIKGKAGNPQFAIDMEDDEKREEFRQTIIKANLIDPNTGKSIYVEENFDKYVEWIEGIPNSSGLSAGRKTLVGRFNIINSDESKNARDIILNDTSSSVEQKKLVVTPEILAKYNNDCYKAYNYDLYIEALVENTVTTDLELYELLMGINEKVVEDARLLIAEKAGDPAVVVDLTDEMMLKAELEGYDRDLVYRYAEALRDDVEKGSLVEEKDLTPVYEEVSKNQIELHFRTSESIKGVAVSGQLLHLDEANTTDIPATEMVYEKNTNNYYRVVLTIPEDTKYKSVTLKFQLEGQENPKETTISANQEGTFANEYWCVFGENNTGANYLTNEEVIEANEYGEAYAYGSFIKRVARLEDLIALIAAVNEEYSYLQGEVTYDFDTWEIARSLYDYAEAEKGLIFPANILNDIGRLSVKASQIEDAKALSPNNNNNLYKVLLLISARSGNIAKDTFIDNVDEEGFYYKDGFDKDTGKPVGNGVDKWKISTFAKNAVIGINHIYKRTYIYNSSVVDFKGSEFNKSPYMINKSAILSNSGKSLVKDVTGDSATLGDIVRYVMNMYINHLQNYPFRVLEIQPVSLAGTLNSYDGAKKLAGWLRIDTSDMTEKNWQEYFKVTSMSVREFNTQNKNLTGEYDLIYFGINSGTMARSEYTATNGKKYRTKFNDSNLIGCVYTGLGDKFKFTGADRRILGSLPTDYSRYGRLTNGTYTGVTLSTGEYNSSNSKYKVSEDYKVWEKYFGPMFDGELTGGTIKFDFSENSRNVYLITKDASANVRGAANDITIKKFDELMDYLKAGYPILMEEEVINCDTSKYIGYSDNPNAAEKWRYLDPESKLYNFVKEAKKLGYDKATGEYTGKDADGNEVFADGYTYPSLVNVNFARYGVNPDNLSAAKKFEGGLSFATKRNYKVNFEYISGPTEYDSQISDNGTGVTIKYGTNEYKRYKIVLEVPESTDMQWLENNYTFQMCVDKSGLGRFAEDNTVMLDPYVDFNYETYQVTIEGNWPSGNDGTIDGFIPWRVEAYQNDNPKNHYIYTGASAFQKVDKNGNEYVKEIEVLWVAADSNTTFDFQAAVNNNPIPEYKLNITKVSYKSFSNDTTYWPKYDDGTVYDSSNTRLKVGVFNSGASAERKQKEFDMIVFGYCDSYTGLDIDNINALKNISYFVSSGHSLFFAHDNSGYQASINNYEYKDSNSIGSGNLVSHNWARYSTSYMRGMLGMDLYGISYGIEKAVTPGSGFYSQSAYNARKYLIVPNPKDYSGGTSNQDYRAALREYQEKLRGICEGSTFRFVSQSSFKNNNGTGDYLPYSLPTTTKVKLVNEGQISTYPFVLNKKKDNAGNVVDKNSIDISTTHYQYLSLNLEDEDTQVWYTLDSSSEDSYYGATSGDGSNQYYIYTKGNVTYTGAGHSTINKTDEIRLFMNTVVAAIKVGNYAPEIKFPDAEMNENDESVLYTYDTDKSITINFEVSDFDYKEGEKNVFSKVNIFFDKIGDDDDNSPVLGDEDYRLNAEGDATETEYMKDPSDLSKKINWNEKNVENRVEHSYSLKYVDLANLYYKLTEGDTTDRYIEMEDGSVIDASTNQPVQFSEITDTVKKLFSEYRLVVQATDIPKNTTGSSIPGVPSKNDQEPGSNDNPPEGITTTVVARMSFRALFNLN